ncbi:hypothetical protein QYE76_063866 [Lolium multiflorum]|uniref:Uncharacterized protein n=1 Tax=Lolium multiflorum TaxID=4521 RepID=A0AAD8S742_LOLMU|nr:hypothetical protein QYE76_063866 [Lolium multiflorum]
MCSGGDGGDDDEDDDDGDGDDVQLDDGDDGVDFPCGMEFPADLSCELFLSGVLRPARGVVTLRDLSSELRFSGRRIRFRSRSIMASNNKGKGLSEEEVKKMSSKQEQQAVGTLRVTDEFCDQYHALRREVEILQEENHRLRRMLERFLTPIKVVPSSPPPPKE